MGKNWGEKVDFPPIITILGPIIYNPVPIIYIRVGLYIIGSQLFIIGSDYLLVGQGLYRDPNSMTIKILITPPSNQP